MDSQLRAQWRDLAERYRFLYRMTLQERLAEMRQDIGDWWWVGGLRVPGVLAGPTLVLDRAGPSHASVASGEPRRSSPPPAKPTLAEPEPIGERPLAGMPDSVRLIIQTVAGETGVRVEEIMSRKTTRRVCNARRECAKRLRKLKYGSGYSWRPSQALIGKWLHRTASTICHTLRT